MDEKTLKNLAQSLSADTEALPYMPYLLQDLWLLGSSPSQMIRLICGHAAVTAETRVLDLACGKGPAAVSFAKKFGCKVLGIDITPEFISIAKAKGVEYGVSELCEFRVDNVVEAAESLKDYDLVIWGAAGCVWGDYPKTLRALCGVIKQGGFVLMDDGYIKSRDSRLKYDYAYPTFDEWQDLIRSAGLSYVGHSAHRGEEIDYDAETAYIKKRAEELKIKYPQKAGIFEAYVNNQIAESDDLSGDELVGVVWLLKKA